MINYRILVFQCRLLIILTNWKLINSHRTQRQKEERKGRGEGNFYGQRTHQRFNVFKEDGAEEEGLVEPEINDELDLVRIKAIPILEKLFTLSERFRTEFGRTLEQIEAGDLPPAISIAATCDGAQQTNNRGMLLYAIKVCQR